MSQAKVTHYELLPTQYDFLFGFDKEKLKGEKIYLDVSLYQGGFGSGKTFCGSLRGLLFAGTVGLVYVLFFIYNIICYKITNSQIFMILL